MDLGPLIIFTPAHLIIVFFLSRWLMPVFHMVLFLALAASTLYCPCFSYVLTKCCMDYHLVHTCHSPEGKWRDYRNHFFPVFLIVPSSFQSRGEYTLVNCLLHEVTSTEQLISQSNYFSLIAVYFLSFLSFFQSTSYYFFHRVYEALNILLSQK